MPAFFGRVFPFAHGEFAQARDERANPQIETTASSASFTDLFVPGWKEFGPDGVERFPESFHGQSMSLGDALTPRHKSLWVSS